MSPRRTLRAFALLCLAALVAAGCGGGGDDDSADTTTTSSTSTSTTTTTEPPPAPTAALTGLPVTDPAVLTRPTLLVKINNADGQKCDVRARPQVGLDKADIVIEEVVEGGITRFMAAFQSNIPETVGPVRSARSSDIDLIEAFNVPLFAWSGNNGGVGAELGAVKDRYVPAGHSSSTGNLYYRDNAGGRCAPSNLFVHPNDLYGALQGQGQVAGPVFAHRVEGETLNAGAVPVSGVKLRSDVDTAFVWNATTATWDRFQRRTRHLAAGDIQLSPQNVVILDVEYKASAADRNSPEAVSTGEGPAHVYMDGAVVEGTWKRAGERDPWTLVDAAGAPIKLVPGQTWVHLARGGGPTNLDAAGAAAYTAA